MSTDDRFQIDDLRVRYSLEPQLRDCFVEGVFDKEVFSQRFAQVKDPSLVCYDIDSVNVPDEVLAALGMTPGNKQRVIALAAQLGDLEGSLGCRFVVDSDLDHWLQSVRVAPRLRYTRYACIEAYFFDSEFVHQCVVVAGRASIPDWGRFYSSMETTLRDLFSLRLANAELGFSLGWISPKKLLSVKSGEIVFDRKEHAKKLVLGGKRGKQLIEFIDASERWCERLLGDGRAFVHGHDFVDLLAWCIRRFGGLDEIASEKVLQRILVLASAGREELDDLFCD